MKQPLAQNAEEGDEMNQSDWESTTDENNIIAWYSCCRSTLFYELSYINFVLKYQEHWA